MNGFIVVDKPAGITSHDAVSKVRRIFGTRKAGHTGTLDPFATGVLPVALGDATKAIPFLDEGVKGYEAVMRLGVVTDTLDMTGRRISEANVSSVSKEDFMCLINAFIGSIRQIPPMFSAVKLDGQPLYKLARKGLSVDREAREVVINELELLDFTPPLVSMRISCSRGTYIRTLADDIGRELGCGAALQELRRTRSGPFLISSAHSLEFLEASSGDPRTLESLLFPVATALSHINVMELSASEAEKVRFGVAPEWKSDCGHHVSAVSMPFLLRLVFKGDLLAVAEASPGPDYPVIKLKRVFA